MPLNSANRCHDKTSDPIVIGPSENFRLSSHSPTISTGMIGEGLNAASRALKDRRNTVLVEDQASSVILLTTCIVPGVIKNFQVVLIININS